MIHLRKGKLLRKLLNLALMGLLEFGQFALKVCQITFQILHKVKCLIPIIARLIDSLVMVSDALYAFEKPVCLTVDSLCNAVELGGWNRSFFAV